ncbi:hypothetical protein AVEN_93505-1 [Araneus ventricosus]|uniref:Uncharacterized protein n=1 Tax=Araneus ventricosus TaxID=182803 RepID=A0A4Y2ARW4_ARAVE|nr:hypothetical protein AVEN_93505-1 [Araneus ventricosus]
MTRTTPSSSNFRTTNSRIYGPGGFNIHLAHEQRRSTRGIRFRTREPLISKIPGQKEWVSILVVSQTLVFFPHTANILLLQNLPSFHVMSEQYDLNSFDGIPFSSLSK